MSRNLAARAGRWSASHRKTAIVGWILFVVLATFVGGNIGQKNLEQSASGNGDSKRGAVIVDKAGFPDTVGERVLIQGKGAVNADSPQVTAAVKDVVSRLHQIKGVDEIKSLLNAEERASTVSHDGRSARDVHAARQGRDRRGHREARAARRRPLGPSPRSRRLILSCASRSTARRRSSTRSVRRSARTRRRAAKVLDGRHAADPAARVRRGRRGRRPAAAGRVLVRGDHRPAGPGQLTPLHPAVQQVTLLVGLPPAWTTRCSTCAG